MQSGYAVSSPKAKKSLGQNFLRDANIARKIVKFLQITTEDIVLEIGPGPGALTDILAGHAPGRLVLVEKDAYWAEERMRAGGGRLSVILTDALTMSWPRFTFPWKCIGNLPYNVASPLLWDICSKAPGLVRAVFMVQKEVGLRITAEPGTSAYGALSVWVQSFMRPKLEFSVPPHVFHPRPKVDSAVLSFIPRQDRQEADGRAFVPEELAGTLRACFQMRRKQLGTIVRSFGNSAALLDNLKIDSRLRPENLTPQDFHRLSGAGIFTGRH
jgi:16S rRNA (adenine1518-N6/adenine1519-N6)-dimethyltransferase